MAGPAELFQLPELSQLTVLLLLSCRLGALLITAPLFAQPLLPVRWRIAMAVGLIGSVWFGLALPQTQVTSLPTDAGEIFVLAVGELLYGAAGGLSLRLLLVAFTAVGELITTTAAITSGDQGSQENSPTQSPWWTLMRWTAIAIFVQVDGPGHALQSVLHSLYTYPPGSITVESFDWQSVLLLAGHSFLLALGLAAPIIVAMSITMVGLGMLGRVLPGCPVLDLSIGIRWVVAGLASGIVITQMPGWLDSHLDTVTGLSRVVGN